MTNNQWVVYALVDPRTDEVRYIGKAGDITDRYRKHLRSSRHERTHKGNWIRLLLREALEPICVILQECESEEHAFECEVALIAEHRAAGVRLTNMTNGGEGTSGYVATEETRQKLRQQQSERLRQLWQDPEYCQRKSEQARQQWQDSDGSQFRIAKSRRWQNHQRILKPIHGRRQGQDPEYRQQQSERLRQLWQDPEFRQRRTERSRQLWQDPEYRQQQSEGTRRLWQDPEWSQRQSERMKAGWAKRKLQQQIGAGQLSIEDTP